MNLHLSPGEQVTYRGPRYKGSVPVNVAGRWQKGLKEPLWIITNT